MAVFLRRPNPKLTDISPVKSQFQPGNRILVRVGRNLDKDEVRKIRRSVDKFVGCSVEILIFNVLQGSIDIERPSEENSIKTSERIYTTPLLLKTPNPRTINLSCTKIDLLPGDRFLVQMNRKLLEEEHAQIRHAISKFAGCEVEILIYDSGELKIEQARGFIQTTH